MNSPGAEPIGAPVWFAPLRSPSWLVPRVRDDAVRMVFCAEASRLSCHITSMVAMLAGRLPQASRITAGQ